MKSIVLISSLVCWTLAKPQQPGRFGSAAWKEAKGFGGGQDTEEMKYQVLEKHDEYMVVRTPPSTWVCTSKDVKSNEDPYKDWRAKYDGNALAAMGDNKHSKTSKMFQILYRYIVGLNSESKNIEMTAPVTNKITEFDDGRMYKDEMCFWLGSELSSVKPPQPNDDNVYIQKRPAMEFYVRKFGGWILSADEWVNELMAMEKSMQASGEGSQYRGVFYTVGYDSPFVPEEKRRNELWIPKASSVSKQADQNPWEKFAFKEVQSAAAAASEGRRNLDSMPYKVLTKGSEGLYELREYPAAKFACTKMTEVVPSKDPMNGWQQKFNNNPLAAMAASKNAKKEDRAPRNKMFMRLFKYILGVNSEGQEIDMTTPVPTTHFARLSQDGDVVEDLEDQEMCFWLGQEWQDKPAPQPIKEDVYVTEKQKLTVYVHRFGGFAFSDEDYRVKYNQFKKLLKGSGLDFEDKVWRHASYNSPWDMGKRRNEIWIPVQNSASFE